MPRSVATHHPDPAATAAKAGRWMGVGRYPPPPEGLRSSPPGVAAASSEPSPTTRPQAAPRGSPADGTACQAPPPSRRCGPAPAIHATRRPPAAPREATGPGAGASGSHGAPGASRDHRRLPEATTTPEAPGRAAMASMAETPEGSATSCQAPPCCHPDSGADRSRPRPATHSRPPATATATPPSPAGRGPPSGRPAVMGRPVTSA